MLSKMQSKAGMLVCWTDLSYAQNEAERKAAMREFERIWAPDIRDWRTRLLDYFAEQGNPEVEAFLESYLKGA